MNKLSDPIVNDARTTAHNTKPVAIAGELSRRVVAASVGSSDELNAEAEELISTAAKLTAENLTDVIKDAQGDEPHAKHRAMNKLKAFSIFPDPQLAARVALMNNKTRRAFFAGLRKK